MAKLIDKVSLASRNSVSMTSTIHKIINLLILGDPMTGKTALIKNALNCSDWTDVYEATNLDIYRCLKSGYEIEVVDVGGSLED